MTTELSVIIQLQPSHIDSDLAICIGSENLRIVVLKATYKDDDGDSS